MNKEMQVRRRIASIYNKREDNFASLRDYNDYLEDVEDIIFNLVQGIDVAETEAKIKAYNEENYEQILASRARKAVEISTALQQEQGFTETREAIEQGPSGAYAPAVAGMLMQQPTRQPEPIGHSLLNGGAAEDPEAQRIREERAAIAGGWSIDCCHRRDLTEAFSSLWVN
ncbi:hypothetical protein SELMODRAFT_440128 [Selaginella moellendorffii]|uniref:MAT1 centre domain-containing protein n=1 Tax=Selaginella moellendorffii TaxID=88036 RepID=D8RA92_SELML|nr:CDK-activating kinase assembly factor MAT1 [Selaginella moellendorffii]XP_024524616.1 CDK-activating kinase assembly factor MAT1 [Selaginella moellendorffii]EFJ31027.1 hypothetical protein SELMODRAFT_440128 [Selaginella moellendorffii]|eukprot:XP_002967680.1 CDK-activating kinase assembly factor MAT1 [Selaginella moellendorffii]